MRLKELRKQKKLNQQAVADVLNCSQAVYSRYENGDREPPLEVLIRLADFYGVSLDALVGRTPMEVVMIEDDPPPLGDDEFELVIKADEKTPSADDLERRIMEVLDRELKKRGL